MQVIQDARKCGLSCAVEQRKNTILTQVRVRVDVRWRAELSAYWIEYAEI